LGSAICLVSSFKFQVSSFNKFKQCPDFKIRVRLRHRMSAVDCIRYPQGAARTTEIQRLPQFRERLFCVNSTRLRKIFTRLRAVREKEPAFSEPFGGSGRLASALLKKFLNQG
jgi:hypothetical protein